MSVSAPVLVPCPHCTRLMDPTLAVCWPCWRAFKNIPLPVAFGRWDADRWTRIRRKVGAPS